MCSPIDLSFGHHVQTPPLNRLLAISPCELHMKECREQFILGVSQLASKISLIRPEMAVFLTKCSKKREGAFHNLPRFFLLENVVYFEFSTCKKPLFPDATAFFLCFRVHHFHHFSPFSSLTQLHLLSSPLLSSSLLSSPLPLLFSPLLSVVFRCLCCVCAVVGARAAVIAPGGFCTFLSGCFSFLGNFSSFLVNFSFTQAIPE